MNDYIKQLEAANEELHQKLIAAEKKLIEKNEDIERRLPRWIYHEGAGCHYGWDIRNIADIRLTTDPDKPWLIWVTGESLPQGASSSMRNFKTLEDAKAMVELIFSNAAKPKS